MGDGGLRYFEDVRQEVQQLYEQYVEQAIQRVQSARERVNAKLTASAPGSAEYAASSQAIANLQRAAIRLNSQREAAKILFEQGLGPISSDP